MHAMHPMHTLTVESLNEEPKIHVSPNEAYASVQLHKPEEVHIYEELNSVTQNQETVITTKNEVYAFTQHSHRRQT